MYQTFLIQIEDCTFLPGSENHEPDLWSNDTAALDALVGPPEAHWVDTCRIRVTKELEHGLRTFISPVCQRAAEDMRVWIGLRGDCRVYYNPDVDNDYRFEL